MLHKHDVGYVNKLNGKQERFSFRKYSFGLASVLLGTAFFALATPNNNNVVHADALSTAQTQQRDNSVTQTASTVTRTINITDPEIGKVTSTTQTASTKNNNGTWSGDSLDAVNIEKPGYTAHVTAKAYYDEKPTPQDTTTELGQVPDAKNTIANNSQMPTGTHYKFDNQPDVYTEGKQNITTKVSTPNGNEYNVKSTVDVVAPEKSVTVNLNDPDGKTVTSFDVTGKATHTTPIDVQSHVPTNWELVGGQQLPSSFTFGLDDPMPINLTIRHKMIDVTNDPDQADKTRKEIKRTIKIFAPGHTNSLIQTASLYRSATKDLVTGKVTYGDWSTGTLPAYLPPKIDGYAVANPDAAPKMTVTVDTPNQEASFTYISDAHTQVINYIDNGKIVDTLKIVGKTGETVSTNAINYIEDKGYNIVGEAPTQVIFGNNDPAPITVNVTKDVTPITPGTPDAVPLRTQTIYVEQGSVLGESEANRAVTNASDFPSGTKFSWVTAPDTSKTGEVTGEIKATYPNGSITTGQTTISVYPNPQPTGQDITYDQGGHLIAIGGVSAVSTTVGTVPDPKTAATEFSLDAPGAQYSWQTTPDVSTDGVKDATLVVTKSDGTVETKPFKIEVQSINPVTGLDNATTSPAIPTASLFANLAATKNAQYEGQEIDPSYALGNITPNDNTPSRIVISVYYTPNDQTDTKTITRTVDYTDPVSGDTKNVTKQTATVSRKRSWIEVENGIDHQDDKNLYRVLNTGSQLSGSDGSASDAKGATIYVRSKIINYGLPENDPNRVTYTDWVRTDSNDNGSTSSDSSTENTSHWGDWSDWSKASFDAVPAPTIKGYTVENPDAAAQINDVSEDSTVTFTYTANSHNQIINYVDGNGATVGTQTVTGKTGEEVPFTANIPDGYWTDDNIPNEITFGTDDPAPITVKVIKKETSNGDVANTDKLPTKNAIVYKDSNGDVVGTEEVEGNPGDKVKPNIPDGYWNGDVTDITIPENGIVEVIVTKKETSNGDVAEVDKLPTKTVIVYKDSNGDVVGTQEINGKPNDKVTPKIPDGYYNGDTDEVTIPENGIVEVTVVKKETSNGDVAEADKLPTKTVIVYKDGNGNVVGTQEISGKPNDKVKTDIPDGYYNGDTDEVTIPESGVVTVNVVKKETAKGTPLTQNDNETKHVIIYKDSNGDVVGTQELTGKPGDKVTPKIPEGYITVDTPDIVIPKDGTPIVVNVVKKEMAKGPTENHEDKADDPIELNGPDSDSEKSTPSDSVTQENVTKDNPIKSDKLVTKKATAEGHTQDYSHVEAKITDKAKTLPQTGVQADKLGLLGLAIASVGALLGLAGTKKRKN